MYIEIQKRKRAGYSQRAAARELDIDRKTVKKYWTMMEDEYAEQVIESKSRTKILDPYREIIVAQIEEYPEITSAIIDAKLRCEIKDFEPSYRSVRLYVANLRDELGLPQMKKVRQFSEVAELPPGFQAQVDMGEQGLPDMYGKKVKVYVFAMVMSHSRKKYAYIQDHKFNAQEFVAAHDMAFRYFGGRTEEIVYDQDRVMAVSENAGDLMLTDAFEAYSKYAGFRIHLCRGNDPQSKGKIERVVGYVKNNYLSCRKYCGISELNNGLMTWLDRVANSKIHDTIKMIPNRVFIEEIRHLKPVPTLSAPVCPKTAAVRKTNVIHYLQNRYEVPKGTYFPGRTARIEANTTTGRVSFYDAKNNDLLAEHNISYTKGRLISLPRNADRFRSTKYETLKASVIQDFGEISGADSFVEKICELYPRYKRDQLAIISKCQKKYKQSELEHALHYCAERELVSANDFRDALEYFHQTQPAPALQPAALPIKYSVIKAQIRSVSAYMAVAKGGDSL
jgi:transposase/predicted CopG family antitoxin